MESIGVADHKLWRFQSSHGAFFGNYSWFSGRLGCVGCVGSNWKPMDGELEFGEPKMEPKTHHTRLGRRPMGYVGDKGGTRLVGRPPTSGHSTVRVARSLCGRTLHASGAI